MKRLFRRLVVYVCMVVVFVGGMGWFGFDRSRDAFYQVSRQEPIPSLHGMNKPKYDPNKPTVAVLLGNESTYGSDFMIPYELFSRTRAFNVYAVASDNRVKTLTGGLDVVLYNGVEELALSSVFDIYSNTGTTKVLSISNSEQPIS